MRSYLSRVRNMSTAVRGLAICAAALGATASAYAAAPRGWFFDNPSITFRHQRPAVGRDVRPSDLRFAAYQADDSVIITASGVNARAGYETSLCDVDREGRAYVVTMHNRLPDRGVGAACLSPFSIVASFRSHGRVECVHVALGCETFEVPVTHAPRIR